ncbi:quinone-dependent dihydroorotate dehydrogenase [Nonomuraea sp. LPB2021202275-12-8]|uniref:quinone-dependent dihydroorotate dehydrogenase n=1 Tax=Nonomuraea sp. LPB2021202275-12-8 TaxID=3120159 RepID=UPI00300D26A6
MYHLLFGHLLRHLPAEAAHLMALYVLRFSVAVPGVSRMLRRLLAKPDAVLAVEALGMHFPSPIGLAAGFDKQAQAVDALAALGFGFIEVGTVTAFPQPGNRKPRVFHLARDRALVNRIGTSNDGASAAAARLRARQRCEPVVGVNIGKTTAVANAEALADYIVCAQYVADVANYVSVNVSSPNTPGLRDLQAVERLRPLIVGVRGALDRRAGRRIPLLVKISPDLRDEDIDELADLALDTGLDGIIAVNTTVSRGGLVSDSHSVKKIGAGGLSGRPLKRRSLEVLRRLRSRAGDQIVLISVGGVETAEDAWCRIRAGATLVQAYTGFVYGGPLWPQRITDGLALLVRQAGFAHVSEAIGVDAD